MHNQYRVPADKYKAHKKYYQEEGMADMANKMEPVDLNDQIVFLEKENESNFKKAAEDVQRRVDNSDYA